MNFMQGGPHHELSKTTQMDPIMSNYHTETTAKITHPPITDKGPLWLKTNLGTILMPAVVETGIKDKLTPVI